MKQDTLHSERKTQLLRPRSFLRLGALVLLVVGAILILWLLALTPDKLDTGFSGNAVLPTTGTPAPSGQAVATGKRLNVPNPGFEQGLSGWADGYVERDKVVYNEEGYVVSIDATTVYESKASALIQRDIESMPVRLGAISSKIAADEARGKRVRYSAYVKAEDVEGWGSLWVKVQGTVDGQVTDPIAPMYQDDGLLDDNIRIRGTQDWQKYEIVFDVPAEADFIAFGIETSGNGRLWLDDVKVEIVGNDVLLSYDCCTRGLENLGFENGLSPWKYATEGQLGQPDTYQAGTSAQAAHGGKFGAYLNGSKPEPNQNGVLWPGTVDALYYRGKTLTFSAYMNADAVKDHAILIAYGDYTKADGTRDQFSVQKVISNSAGLKGWQYQEVTFKVSTTMPGFYLAIRLYGEGELWVDDVSLDER